MRYKEIILEFIKKKMGRELNHLEDYLLFYGSEGAKKALEILHDITQSESHDLTIKWDGKLALFYGRDENGDFALGTKGSWAKKVLLKTPEEVYQYVTTTGKGEDWRNAMGKELADMFPVLEQSVPKSFKGFVTGDLLYSPSLSPKKVSNGKITFTPNQVTYIVDPNSDLGKRIANTDIGVALHLYFDEWGGSNKSPVSDSVVKQLNSDRVFVTGLYYVSHKPKLDLHLLKTIESMIQKYGNMIDNLVEPKPGLSDIPNMLYAYNNNAVRSHEDPTAKGFLNWVKTSGKVSANKQKKIEAMYQENPTAFKAIFELFMTIQEAKDSIISQLDSAMTDIKAINSNGNPGGEGYVSLKHSTKLVPRKDWKPK